MKASYFELMDTESANVVGFYETKDEALAIVRSAFENHGTAGIDDLALSENDGQGSGVLLAEGAELPRLAIDASLVRVAG